MENKSEATDTIIEREEVASQERPKPNPEESKHANTEALINASSNRMTKSTGKYFELMYLKATSFHHLE